MEFDIHSNSLHKTSTGTSKVKLTTRNDKTLTNVCTNNVNYSFHYYRVPDELQSKLSSCLRICFCPSEGEPYAVLRFWDYLLSAVQSILTHQSYSMCSSDLQVKRTTIDSQ